MFVYNIFYTVFGACTSIVSQNQNGEIFHARNLDFGLWPAFDVKHHNFWLLNEKLRPLVVNIDFQRGGQTVFKSTTFAGFAGVHTAMRPGAFALSVDTKFDGNLDLGLIEWIESVSRGLPSKDVELTMLNREVMQTLSNYGSAKEKIASTKLIGPAYIIVSGMQAGEGAVITKGKPEGALQPDGQTIDVWELQREIDQVSASVGDFMI